MQSNKNKNKKNNTGKENKKNKKLVIKSNKSKIKNKANLETQNESLPNITNNDNNSGKNTKNKNLNNYSLINIQLNLSGNHKHIPPDSHIILNNYNFKEAIKYDLRELCVIFYIFALAKQIFFHTFLFRSPLELFSLRLCLFFFIISSDLALNALFYFNSNISKKYRNAKNIFLFAFSDNIIIITLAIVIGFILLTLLSKLSNSINAIKDIFKKEEEKMVNNNKYVVSDKRKKEIINEIDEILKKYKIKVVILIIIELIIFLFFWYFVTAFCHVYAATQMSWLIDSLLSILFRAIIELLISLGLAKLYRLAIAGEIECLYKIVMFIYNFE